MKRVLVCVVALLFIGIGVFMFVNANNLAKRCTVKATGTVVEIYRDETYDGEDGMPSYTYYPVIEYEVNGKKIIKRHSNGSNPSKYMENDKVDILYNPDNIEEYIINGDKSSNIISILFVVVGLIVLIIGLFFYKAE